MIIGNILLVLGLSLFGGAIIKNSVSTPPRRALPSSRPAGLIGLSSRRCFIAAGSTPGDWFPLAEQKAFLSHRRCSFSSFQAARFLTWTYAFLPGAHGRARKVSNGRAAALTICLLPPFLCVAFL
jgi:hypothetical protein